MLEASGVVVGKELVTIRECPGMGRSWLPWCLFLADEGDGALCFLHSELQALLCLGGGKWSARIGIGAMGGCGRRGRRNRPVTRNRTGISAGAGSRRQGFSASGTVTWMLALGCLRCVTPLQEHCEVMLCGVTRERLLTPAYRLRATEAQGVHVTGHVQGQIGMPCISSP